MPNCDLRNDRPKAFRCSMSCRSLGREQRQRLSTKSAFGKALQYALSRWDALTRYTTDGRLSIDNNLSEGCCAASQAGNHRSLSSSVCKHWKLVFRNRATRRYLRGDRRLTRQSRGRSRGSAMARR